MTSPSDASKSLRLAHVGDIQMGGGYSLGTEDDGGVNSRLRDFEAAWLRSCDTMIAEHVDLVLVAGDVFETPKPTPTEKEAFAAGLRRLIYAGIKVIGCVGNHESPRQVGRKHGLAIFNGFEGSETLFADRASLVTADQLGLPVAVALMPHINPAHIAARDPEYAALGIDDRNHYLVEQMLDVLRGLAVKAGQSKPALGVVLVAHGTIAGSVIGAEQSTMLLRDPVLPLPELQGLGYRYQAWGHIHKAQELAPGIAYCGSLERLNWSEAHDPDKGFWLVDITEDQVTSAWRSSLPRPFLDIEIADPSSWQVALPEDAEAVRGAIVRIRYTTSPEIQRTIDQDAIRRAFYSQGAQKVYGPIVTITRDAVTTNHLTEEMGALEAWRELATLKGISGEQFERLEGQVREALEVCNA